MVKNKKTLISFFLFILGLILSLSINEYVNDSDRYHWLILAPIIFPLVASYFAIIGIWKTKSYERLTTILLLLANLGLAVVIFITYAFSYWEF